MRHILLYLTLVLAFGCEKEKEEVPEAPYAFYVAGHVYGASGVDNIGVHPPFKAKFDYLRDYPLLDFGVFTGDIVREPTEQKWDEIDADVLSLGHPVYFAVGNHDMRDRPLYESRYGDTYHSFIHASDLFLILDPNLDSWNISGDQLQFVQETLSEHECEAKNIFVFFHQLLWWSPDNIYQGVSLNSTEGRADPPNFWAEIQPLFEATAKPVYMFAGDVGAYTTGSEFMYHQVNNVTHIASGMGGGVRDNIIIIDVLADKSVQFKLTALNTAELDALGRLEDYTLPE